MKLKLKKLIIILAAAILLTACQPEANAVIVESAQIRTNPSNSGKVVDTAVKDSRVTAGNFSPDGQWIRISFGDSSGWIDTNAVSLDDKTITRPAPTSTLPPPTTYQVTLFCPDCADVGMEINLWTNPDRSGIAGSVPHNTAVPVLDSKMVDGTRYYYVRRGNARGWVSETMVKR